MMESQIPFACKHAELENLAPAIAAQVQAGLAEKRGALLYGATGLGKTFAMIAAMKAVASLMPPRRFGPNVILDEERNTICSFVDWPEFIASLHRSNDQLGRLFAWRGPLFVDDVGQEHAAVSGFKQGESEAVFDQFINRRTGVDVPLWITTNLTPNEISNRYGERAMSRIAGHCELINFSGADRRLA
jgi:DNA replication protein DnaC